MTAGPSRGAPSQATPQSDLLPVAATSRCPIGQSGPVQRDRSPSGDHVAGQNLDRRVLVVATWRVDPIEVPASLLSVSRFGRPFELSAGFERVDPSLETPALVT